MAPKVFLKKAFNAMWPSGASDPFSKTPQTPQTPRKKPTINRRLSFLFTTRLCSTCPRQV